MQALANEGGLLVWQKHGEIYHTFTNKASGIVYPCDGGFHWEIFSGDKSWHGQVETLHSAKSHVEGNFVGRGFLSRSGVHRIDLSQIDLDNDEGSEVA